MWTSKEGISVLWLVTFPHQIHSGWRRKLVVSESVHPCRDLCALLVLSEYMLENAVSPVWVPAETKTQRSRCETPTLFCAPEVWNLQKVCPVLCAESCSSFGCGPLVCAFHHKITLHYLLIFLIMNNWLSIYVACGTLHSQEKEENNRLGGVGQRSGAYTEFWTYFLREILITYVWAYVNVWGRDEA